MDGWRRWEHGRLSEREARDRPAGAGWWAGALACRFCVSVREDRWIRSGSRCWGGTEREGVKAKVAAAVRPAGSVQGPRGQ